MKNISYTINLPKDILSSAQVLHISSRMNIRSYYFKNTIIKGNAPLITTTETCGLDPSTHTAVCTLLEPTTEWAMTRSALHSAPGNLIGRKGWKVHKNKCNFEKKNNRKLNWAQLNIVDTNWLIRFIPDSIWSEVGVRYMIFPSLWFASLTYLPLTDFIWHWVVLRGEQHQMRPT